MLTGTDEGVAGLAPAALRSELHATSEGEISRGVPRLQLAKMARVEWIGQTVASGCWIASVFAYGISGPGDWLQLGAATAWLIANLAAAAAED